METLESRRNGPGRRPIAVATRLALVVATLLAATQAAWSQTQAKVSGTVTTAEGAPAPGIVMRFEPMDGTGALATAETNKKGSYVIGLLRPGKYKLVVDTKSEFVPLRVKSKGTLQRETEKEVLWDVDQEVSPAKPAEINVGARNQIDLDVVVGPPALTAEARRDAEIRATQGAFEEGLAKVKSGDFAGALTLLTPLTRKSPDHANTWYLVAFSRERLSQWDDALAATDQLLKLDPQFAGGHLLRGRILKGQGRLDEAEGEFKKEVARNADPGTVYDSQIALADLHKAAKRLPEAIADLEAASSLKPEAHEPYAQLAQLYSATGDREKAAAALERAEKSGGVDDPTLLNLAIGYLNEGKADEAEKLAKRLIEKGSTDPNLSLANSILARACLSRGDLAAGAQHLEQALALDPASKLATENREILDSLKTRK